MKNIFRQLYELLDDYFSRDERQEIMVRDARIRALNKELGVLKKELLEKDKKIALAESELSILKKKLEDSNGVEETRKKVYSMLDKSYKRVIIEYRKRKIPGKKKYLPLLANDFVRPSNTLAYRFRKYKLTDIWKYKIQYVYDSYQYHGMIDEWQFPEETLVLGKGDCDDSTAFRVAVAKSLGLEKGFRLFMAVGILHNPSGDVGHAFPVMIMDNGNWYVLEATTNDFSMLKYPNKQYSIQFLWDEYYAWQIGGNPFGGKILKYFDLHKQK